jgi:hypothetical protein
MNTRQTEMKKITDRSKTSIRKKRKTLQLKKMENSLREAFAEVKKIQSGELIPKTIEQFLSEL